MTPEERRTLLLLPVEMQRQRALIHVVCCLSVGLIALVCICLLCLGNM
jgi:hypothetical protein